MMTNRAMDRRWSLVALVLLMLASIGVWPSLPGVRAQEGELAQATSEVEPNDSIAQANIIGIGASRPMQARIDPVTDADFFQFIGAEGQVYVVETFNVAGAINSSRNDMELAVFDPNGTQLIFNSSNSNGGVGNTNTSVSFSAAIPGPYTIRVNGSRFGTRGIGPYSIRVLPNFDHPEASWDANHEPNNWPSNAFALNLGPAGALTTRIEQRSNAYITSAADVDWFRFEAVEGQPYVVETFNVAGAINTSRWSMNLAVYDPDGTRLTFDRNNSHTGVGNTNTSVTFIANRSGTYFIVVWPQPSGAGSGPYSIRVLPNYDQPEASWDANHEPNNWPSNAFALNLGPAGALTTTIEQRSNAFLTSAADVDWFRFEAIEGRPYVVETFNVAGAINTSRWSMNLALYDSDGTRLTLNSSNSHTGVGNTNTSARFIATKSGTYMIAIWPEASGAGSGPYSIRVLPRFDQPEASWNAALEPNNWPSNAVLLPIEPCGLLTSLEARNAAFLTSNPDVDWFRFEVENGKQYRLAISEPASGLTNSGFYLELFNRDLSELREQYTTRPIEFTFTAEYSGLYYARIRAWGASTAGTYRITLSDPLAPGCNGAPPARAVVDGNVSSGTNPNTGEVVVRGPATGNVPVTFTVPVVCESGTPQGVTLLINGKPFAMTATTGNRYQVSLRIPADLPAGGAPYRVSVTYRCGGQERNRGVGGIELFDPSGTITDAVTGAPIKGAVVSLFRMPGALPDRDGQQRDCRTVNTRGGNDWSGLPAADVTRGLLINPLLDAINGTQQISPQINPQITGNDGSYAWDVVEGCWFVSVEATGYETLVSPVVGVPPEVTDLHLQLQPLVQNQRSQVFLPLLRR